MAKDFKRENYEITNLKYEILVCPNRKLKRNMIKRLLELAGMKPSNKNLNYYFEKDRFTLL